MEHSCRCVHNKRHVSSCDVVSLSKDLHRQKSSSRGAGTDQSGKLPVPTRRLMFMGVIRIRLMKIAALQFVIVTCHRFVEGSDCTVFVHRVFMAHPAVLLL